MPAKRKITQYAAGSLVAIGLASGIVKPWEGKKNEAYSDPIGIVTICYGHTASVTINDYRTDGECEQLLASDLSVAFGTIDRNVTTPISNEEAAAYASFIYNAGAGNFARSTLLRKLNSGDRIGACNELPKWVYAGGQKLRGLERRRAAEQDLCLSGAVVDLSAPPAPTLTLWQRIKGWFA